MMRRRSTSVLVAVVLACGGILLGTTGGTATAQTEKAGVVLPSPDPVPGEYIVTLSPGASNAVLPTVADLTDKYGGRVLSVYAHALQGYAVAASEADAKALAADPAVASVEQNGYVHATDITSPQSPTPSWGLDRVDQHPTTGDNSYSWTADGAGVHAYILDSGINTSLADFGGRASVGIDEVIPSNGGQDCAGHGTHVAGTVGGTTYGVAKKVSLVAVRVLGCSGFGSMADVIDGVDWVTANAIRPAVANMSVSAAQSTALDTAVANSIVSGITYAVAAGNDGLDACTSSPADVLTALTVGATDITDTRASFSDFGRCIDLFAPGVNIVSDWPVAPFVSTRSGTSMSTPHVAGVAATYLSAYPCATVDQVTAVLLGNATAGAVTSPGALSPNRLLFNGFGAPSAPCAPAAQASGGNNVVNLAWASGTAATSFSVYRGTAPGAEAAAPIAANLAAGASSFGDATAVNGTTYYYQVAAVNSAGQARSPEVSATPAGPPSAPTLGVPTPGNGTVHLGWTAPASNGGAAITQYRVYRGTSPGGQAATPVGTVDGVTLAYDDNSVSNGTTYYYTVGAVNAAGETRSAERSALPVGPPAAPAVTVQPHLSKVTLTWTVPANGGSPITRYTVYRGPTSTFVGATAVSPASLAATTYDDTSVAPGTGYSYWVTATNGLGEGPPSAAQPGVAGATVDVFNQTGTAAGITAQRISGSSAAAPTSLASAGFGAPAATADATGTAVFMRGSDGALWWRRILPSGPTPWSSLGGGLSADPAPVATSSGIDVFVRGNDGSVYWKQFSGGTVASATPLGGFAALGGYSTSPPSVATIGATKYVAVRGGDGGAYVQVVTTAPTSWRGLGGYISSNPAVARDAVAGGGVTVFARGGDLAMYAQHVAANGTPAGWSSLGGGITSNPGASFDGTTTYVFARGNDGGVYYRALPPTGPPPAWIGLGGYASSDPHAVYDGTRVRVLVRGGDNQLYWQAPGFVGWTGLPGTTGLYDPAVTDVP